MIQIATNIPEVVKTIQTSMAGFIVKENNLWGGIQVIFKFPNGYGASVVNHEFSYGTELAVVKFEEGTLAFDIVYDTPLTDDVIGYISSVEELLGYLEQIKNLEAENEQNN